MPQMVAYNTKILFFLQTFCLLSLFTSCQKEFNDSNFTAYFGGEVINPTTNYVLFLKDDVVIDTLYLDQKNQFLKKFDSLAPGLYTFKHEPEYQYVFFDKNDSLMVRINSVDFDESVVFCGRGDEKNNFLMELYLKNDADRKSMFDLFDYDITRFLKSCDSSYQSKQKFYTRKKNEINWSDDFDLYAKTMLDLNHFAKKEIYPVAHKMRMGVNVSKDLPQNYYDHRKKIDFNNNLLIHYSPFVRYLTHMMSNISFQKVSPSTPENEILQMSVTKLNIADTLFKQESVKNKILKNIAFSYLLEDQSIENNKIFLTRYNQLSNDTELESEINKIGQSIQSLKPGNVLPSVTLLDLNGNQIKSESLFNRKTVVFFWTENATSHISAVHKKAIDFNKQYPNYQFVAINIDEDQGKWRKALENYSFGTINEFRAENFEDLKEKWVITKLHRTLIVEPNGVIKNAFVNLFDINFSENLK